METAAHRRGSWRKAAALLCCALAARAGAQVTTRGDEVGRLLNLWFNEGSAAGLAALTYENRDGAHSPLATAEWPQLRVYKPTEDELRRGLASGAALGIRPFPLIANASMAAPAEQGGSIPRLFQSGQSGFALVTGQYLNNNLVIYPSHQDYKPGANGVGGWGDLYPANTACLLTSLGSSYTDQPFLRAFLAAAAALDPGTQRRLIHSRLLMPTLQALFRRSNKPVTREEDYFTGRAHPPVFRGEDIDEERFVRTAHGLTTFAIPPIAFIEMVSESPTPLPARDFFELPAVTGEALAETPCAIARIFRGSAMRRSMTVSARRSADHQGRDLEIRWALLQGDPERVRIEPSADGMEAKITVTWHPQIRAASGITSHRVDIGVFASNGITWSAPAFLTVYMLPNEDRHYRADGRIAEICYDRGNPHLGLPASGDLRWLHLGRRLSGGDRTLAGRLLREAIPPPAAAILRAAADELAARQQQWRELNADKAAKPRADAALATLQTEIRRRVETPLPGGLTVRAAVERAISALAQSPDLFTGHQDAIAGELGTAGPVPELDAARRRAVDYRLFLEPVPGRFMLLRDPEKLTAGERARLTDLHLTLLGTLLLPQFLERSNVPAFVDGRLTTPKAWRDVYRYGPDGSCTGWTRITNGREYEFDHLGRLLPDGRSGRAVEVKYLREERSRRLLFAPR